MCEGSVISYPLPFFRSIPNCTWRIVGIEIRIFSKQLADSELIAYNACVAYVDAVHGGTRSKLSKYFVNIAEK
jgi:hypothetical protein